MNRPNQLSFTCRLTDEGSASLTPYIDGGSLAELVEAFEIQKGYIDPPGGYSGIVAANFRLGPLEAYFLGQGEPVEGGDQGQIYALFCECGEAGCWPLFAQVRIDGDRVTWSHFGQPHRPARDYRGFGPFEFALNDYAVTVAEAATFADEAASFA